MRAVELFAGVGGFRLGLERAGHKTIWANEWDKHAAAIYEKRLGKIDTRDITTVRADEIPAHDLLCGGFPCQAFSIAGKRAGFNEVRGTLFFDICRIARHHRTPYLFLENVKGLLNHEGGATFHAILRSLDELGYDCQWQVLNSKDFGVPQNRERVFIVGHLRGKPRPEVFPLRGAGPINHGLGIRSDQAINKGQSGRVYDPDGLAPTLGTMTGGGNKQPKIRVREATKQGYAEAAPGDSINLKAINSTTRRGRVGRGIANTIETSSQQAVVVPGRIRKLTPLECERLQGFPDNWTGGVSDTHRYKMMGNAVTVNVIEAIAKRLPKVVK